MLITPLGKTMVGIYNLLRMFAIGYRRQEIYPKAHPPFPFLLVDLPFSVKREYGVLNIPNGQYLPSFHLHNHHGRTDPLLGVLRKAFSPAETEQPF
jgi:hypothetical protein